MSDVLIHPARDRKEPALEGAGLLAVNPGEAVSLKRRMRELDGQRRFLFNSNLYQIARQGKQPPFFWAGPAVGAPMAVLVLEKLVALGAKRVIVYGWCGSLTPDLAVGDILLPTWTVSEEGTSRHYVPEGRSASSGALRKELAQLLAPDDFRTIEAPVWTTDAPYRETRTKVQAYAAEGVAGVDMEFSALCTVASFRGIELAGVMLVSDELWRENWSPGFNRKHFKKKSGILIDRLLRICRDLPPQSGS